MGKLGGLRVNTIKIHCIHAQNVQRINKNVKERMGPLFSRYLVEFLVCFEW